MMRFGGGGCSTAVRGAQISYTPLGLRSVSSKLVYIRCLIVFANDDQEGLRLLPSPVAMATAGSRELLS